MLNWFRFAAVVVGVVLLVDFSSWKKESMEEKRETVLIRILLHHASGKQVTCVGAVPELGNWKIAQGLPMNRTESSLFVGEFSIKFPFPEFLEYKFVGTNSD